MLEYYGVGCFVTQTGNTCTYCWYITLLVLDKQTNIHTTQRINLNNAIDPRNLPSLLLFVVSSLFSRDYFWLCQVSHSFSKEESSKIADERFLQARCLFCHPINSVKAKHWRKNPRNHNMKTFTSPSELVKVTMARSPVLLMSVTSAPPCSKQSEIYWSSALAGTPSTRTLQVRGTFWTEIILPMNGRLTTSLLSAV